MAILEDGGEGSAMARGEKHGPKVNRHWDATCHNGVIRNRPHIQLVCTNQCAGFADLLSGKLVKILTVQIQQPADFLGLLCRKLSPMRFCSNDLKQEEIPNMLFNGYDLLNVAEICGLWSALMP